MRSLPRKRYAAILADPPWHFKTWSVNGRDRCPDSKHYRTLDTNDIQRLPVSNIAKPNAVLFLWATWPMLQDALAVIEAWQFKYKTCGFAWMKTGKPAYLPGGLWSGTGYWTRANTEVCLLATRGSPKRINRDVAQAILEPRREHSRKPEIYDRIERLVRGPYIELFARQRHEGWDAWGNETGKFK